MGWTWANTVLHTLIAYTHNHTHPHPYPYPTHLHTPHSPPTDENNPAAAAAGTVLEVFEDDPHPPPTTTSTTTTAAAPAHTSHPPAHATWTELGSRADTSKENTMQASTWAGTRLTQKGGGHLSSQGGGGGDGVLLDVYHDEECTQAGGVGGGVAGVAAAARDGVMPLRRVLDGDAARRPSLHVGVCMHVYARCMIGVCMLRVRYVYAMCCHIQPTPLPIPPLHSPSPPPTHTGSCSCISHHCIRHHHPCMGRVATD